MFICKKCNKEFNTKQALGGHVTHCILSVHTELFQRKEVEKIEEIKKCGFTPYIIEDLGGENKEFVDKEFSKLKEFLNKKGTIV